MEKPSGISRMIYRIRGRRVILSGDLAKLYQVTPKSLVQAVKRNRARFPMDFMFQLSRREFENLKPQTVTSSWGGIRRACPYAFTEQGVAMLSSVLRSPRAIRANIAIMRAFVKTRALVSQNREILQKLSSLEGRVDRHDAEIGALIDAIRESVEPEKKTKPRIGFEP